MSIAFTSIFLNIPCEVRDFADRNGLTNYLQPVAELTRDAFGGGVREVCLESDPEDAADTQIEFVVDVTGWTSDEMLAARQRWTQALIASPLPSSARYQFRIFMEQRP